MKILKSLKQIYSSGIEIEGRILSDDEKDIILRTYQN
jgi:hypothetical protein